MTKYLVEEIVTPGYSINRGVYDNPKDAQYRAMETFVNVDEDGFAMVGIKNESDAETALKEHVIHCQELYRRTL